MRIQMYTPKFWISGQLEVISTNLLILVYKMFRKYGVDDSTEIILASFVQQSVFVIIRLAS